MRSYNGFPKEQREKFYAWLKEQWRSGLLAHPYTCHACGQSNGFIDIHTEDYSEPFSERQTALALCYICHMMLHARFRFRGHWDTYREAIRRGGRFEPRYGRNFEAFARDMLDVAEFAHEPIYYGMPRTFPLDEIDEKTKWTAKSRDKPGGV